MTRATVHAKPPQDTWTLAAMLALSLALGIAIAAGLDALQGRDEVTAAALLVDSAATLVIAAVMIVLGRMTRRRPLKSL